MTLRVLTVRERDVLVAMIRQAPATNGPGPDLRERQRLLAMIPEVRVFGTCACRHCPSIELWPTDEPHSRRMVLTAESPDLGLLLFVDDGRPTYLEAFPYDSGTVAHEFPPVDEITF